MLVELGAVDSSVDTPLTHSHTHNTLSLTHTQNPKRVHGSGSCGSRKKTLIV